jgi:tetratricopeptide (TPR) repeat protein
VTADHPTTEMLDQLLAGTLAGEEARWAVAHAVGRCGPCLRYLRAAQARSPAGPYSPGTPGTQESPDRLEIGAYDGVFDLSLERSAAGAAGIRAHQLEAATLWATLADTPAARRLELVTADPRFHTWALASRLLDAAGEFQWRDSGQEIDGCRLALAIAERLPQASYPASLAGDLRARALGGLADALRLDGDLAAAEETLDRAWEALEEGSGDPLEHAALLRFAANLQLTLGDGAAAAALLRPAAAIYRLYGDRHQQGRTLQKLALAVGHDDPRQGVAIAERALALVDPGREPRVELAARHILIWFLNDCGLAWQALDLYDRSRPLYGQCGDSEALLLAPWLEARICRRLGELAAAERGLGEAWHLCRAADWHQEQTLVSLDLAEALIAQGKSRHALRLLGACQVNLGSWGMHAEGMAAWRLLLDVTGAGADAGSAAALLREAALYFRRAWRRALPFSRPAA